MLPRQSPTSHGFGAFHRAARPAALRGPRLAPIQSALAVLLLMAAAWPVTRAGAEEYPPPAAGINETLGRGRIRGEVGLSRREKIAGVVVAMVAGSGSSGLFLTATDADGVFLMDGLPEGLYDLIVSKDGFQPALEGGLDVHGPFRTDTDVRIRAGEGPPLVVRVVGGGATAVPGKVVLLATDPRRVPREGARFEMRSLAGGADPLNGETARDGRLELPPAPPGEYTLRIEAAGCLPLRLERLVVEGSGEISVRAVLIERPFGYEGTPADLLPDEKPVPPPEITSSPVR